MRNALVSLMFIVGVSHSILFAADTDKAKPNIIFIFADDWGYDDDYDNVMATYHQQIHAIDVAVGMIREALNEQSVADNTVIIYTSDNGFFCGSHGYGSKVLPYEEGSRVPLLVYDPRHPNSGKQLRCEALTGNIDFAPTMLLLAGLAVPENIDGADLMKLYDDPLDSIHDSLALINVYNQSGPPITHAMAVVTKERKYIYWPYAAEGFESTEELYQLGDDPLELRDLARIPDYGDDLKKMRNVYDRHLDHWKSEGVTFNNYKPYTTIFDRNADWADKVPHLEELKRKTKRR